MAYDDTINGLTVDRRYTRVVNIKPQKIKFVRSFDITDHGTFFSLKINQTHLIGKYPTVNAALGALVGCFHAVGCNEEFAFQQITSLLNSNRGKLPATGVSTPLILNSEGWDTYLTVPGTITNGADPLFDYPKSFVTITRSGYNASGSVVNKTINTALQNTVRLPYPNETSEDTTDLGSSTFKTRTSLGKWVYSTDSVEGGLLNGFDEGITQAYVLDVTNNSTLNVPPVIANWTCPVVDYVHNNDLVVDLAAAHMSAENGNMGIACVKFKLYKNDSSTVSETATVTSPTNRTSSTTGLTYPVFTNTFNISSDVDGTKYRIACEVYPVWGTMKASEEVAYDSLDRCVYTERLYDLYRWKNSGPAIPTVYVDSAGSDSNSGTFFSPFATLEAAVNSLYTTNGTNAEGIIRCTGNIGNFELVQNVAASSPTKPLKIMSTASATVVGGCLSSGRQTFRNNVHVIVENITFDYSTALDSNYGDGVTPGFATLWGNSSFDNQMRVCFKNCSFNSGTNTGASGYMFMYLSLDFIECTTIDGMGASAFFASNPNPIGLYRLPGMFIGCHDYTGVGNMYYCTTLGSDINAQAALQISNPSLWATSVFPARTSNNYIFGWNKVYQNSSGSKALSKTDGDDCLIACNWLEQVLGFAAVGPAVGIYNDGNTINCDNILVWHNSVMGQRSNLFYNDEGTAAVYRQNVQVKGNLFSALYIKSDTFSHPTDGPNSNRTGNWGCMNMVDWTGNAAPITTLSFNFDYETAKTYFDDDNTPLIFASYPANGTRSIGDAPIGLDASWETATGWSWSTTESPVPILQNNTTPSKIGAI